MASYMPPFNKLMYESVRRQSESQSEISSVDSDWSDIKSIAMQLGVANPDDLMTERFKIDRQKLENMIQTEIPEEGTNKAEEFFESTMKITSTFISWPCRLKIGAKTKKDPHVRIVGKPEDVFKAKERILEFLDSKGIRVIMKIDISYTDHSYIIGRGGSNIKRIMEQTMTHIHFPDSNRSNPVEKSNQVSLCGSLEGVELARSLVRSSTPLIISFELPIMAPGRPVPDNETQYVRDVEAKFNIQVIFSTRPKLHSSLVLVKGSEKEAAKVQEATQLLINFMCESIANQIHVNLQLEISPHHQDIVKGKNNSQLLSIMERTKTKIIFPDTKDVNIKPLKKSQVTITGTIDGVYRARQQLIGNLPVALIFDYPENPYDTANITTLGNKYGVFITVRQKSRQSIMCIVLKGVEKFVDKIYECRHELLQLQTPLLKPDIPSTYFAPNDHELEHSYRKNLALLLSNYPESPSTPNIMHMGANPFNMASPFGQLMDGALKFGNNASTSHLGRMQSQTMNYRNMHLQQQQLQQAKQQAQQQQHLQVPHPQMQHQLHLQQHQQQQQQQFIKAQCMQQTNPFLSPFQQHPLQQQQQQQQQQQGVGHNMPQMSYNTHNSSANTSGYHSYSSSTTSLEQLYAPYQPGAATANTIGNANNAVTSAVVAALAASAGNFASQQTGTNSNNGSLDYSPDSNGGGNSNNFIDGSAEQQRRVSSGGRLMTTTGAAATNKEMEMRTPTFNDVQHFYTAEQRRKIEGYKAMERAPQGEVRTPNASWAGLGLSKTSPFLSDATTTVVPPPPPSVVGSGGGSGSDSGAKLNGSSCSNNSSAGGQQQQQQPWLRKSNNTFVGSPYNLNMTTGLMDIVPTNQRSMLSHHKDIHSLLTHLGLEHYISTFVVNEVDIDMFASLTSENLTELGITAFGPRKKLLMAISALNAHRVDGLPHATSSKFSGSAAPGAERRLSSEW